LGLKMFFVVISTIFTILGIVWLIAVNLVPTREEIDTRRQELAVMESRALDLERRGVNLVWSVCSGSPCFRTNETEGAWGSGGETWRRPYKTP